MFPILDQCGNDKMSFLFYVRADKDIIQKMKKILPKLKNPKRFVFFIGSEFPSKKMNRILKRGLNNKQLIDLFEIVTDNNVNLKTSFILGWNILDKQDYKESSEFIGKIPEETIVGVGPLLFLGNNKQLLKLIGDSKIIQSLDSTYFDGIVYPTNKEAIRINKMVLEKLYDMKFKALIDVYKSI